MSLDKNISLKIKVEQTELEEALKKVNQLKELLMEVQEIISLLNG